MALPQVPPETARAPAARRIPAAAILAAVATPATGPSSTTAAPATTTVRRIRPRIATPAISQAHAASGAGDRGKPGSSTQPRGERCAETGNDPPLAGQSVTRALDHRQHSTCTLVLAMS